MRVLYYLVIGILFPFFLASSAIRAWRQTRSADPTLQRLGHVDRAPSGPVIWVHASSVGEMQAAIPLVRSLQADYPETHIVVSSFTAAGMQRARAAFGETVQVCPLPYDFPRFARRFLNRIRPLALIVMETEIWPSLFRLCGERRIPVLLASARVTARSTRRYARLGSLLRESLESVQLVAAQSEGDAHRFAELGVHASRIKVSGNLKFDLEPSAEIIEQGRAMRQLLFGAAPVLIAASTRIGEDEAVLEAFRQVREKQADARLLIVPRHPERGTAVLSLVEQQGFVAELRSRDPQPSGVDVYVVDTIGELNAFLAAADAAFVGGSLVDAGGHNLLEPAVIGVPVLTGPHHSSTPDIFETMRAADALLVVEDADQLGDAWNRLLEHPEERDRLGQLAGDIVADNRGALERLQELLGSFLQSAR